MSIEAGMCTFVLVPILINHEGLKEINNKEVYSIV